MLLSQPQSPKTSLRASRKDRASDSRAPELSAATCSARAWKTTAKCGFAT